jgi:four helix bundle protein
MTEESLSIVEDESSPIYNVRHRAFYFSKEVVLFIGKQKFDKIYFSLFDQLMRSSTSIGANLAEGFAGSSKNDFIKFNIISLKSANETKYWLCLIRDTLGVDKNILEKFIKEADELSKIIASIIINSKK